jgi:hypothetical protein
VELLGILRALARHRLIVFAGAILSVAVALAAAHAVSLNPPGLHREVKDTGYASQRILVDTPKSLVAEAAPPGGKAIATKAGLLASVLDSEEARALFAQAIDEPLAEVAVNDLDAALPPASNALAEKATESTAAGTAPYAVNVSQSPGLSLLTISAVAPDARTARELVAAAPTAMRSISTEVLAPRDRIRFEAVGPVVAESRQVSKTLVKPMIVGILLFLVWCVGTVTYDRLRGRRASARRAKDRRSSLGAVQSPGAMSKPMPGQSA